MSRPLERDRPFQAALIVAFLFHLSALTVFSIVVRFHKAEIPYSTLALVDSRRLDLATSDAAPAGLESSPGLEILPLGSTTPKRLFPFQLLATNEKISYPSLAASLRKWDQQTQQNADVDTASAANDIGWSFTMKALQGAGKDIRHGIEQLALLGYGDSGKKPASSESAGEPAPLTLSGVADGYEVTMAWISPPYNRRALFTPRIQFRPTPSVSHPSLTEPLSLFVQVSSDGSVTTVLPRPIQDPAGVVEDVVATVKRFQFEPLPADAPQRDQTGTLTIERPKE